MQMSKNLKEVARVIVTNDNGEFLVGKKRLGGNRRKWMILGGGINNGETPKKAALRELREESGRDPIEITFLFKNTFGDWLTYYYLCTNISKQKRRPDKEHSLIKFMPLSKLSKRNMGQDHFDVLKKVSKFK